MTKTTIYLLRHAQSAPKAGVPESDWPLSETGAIQAEILVELLHRLQIDKTFSSPFLRARDTVSPFCMSTNTIAGIEEDLRERKLKEEHSVEDWKSLLEKSWKDFSFSLPNCESGFSCQQRISNCISKLVKMNRAKTLLVSSHGNAIGLYLNKLDPSFGFQQWESMRNPDLFKITFLEDEPIWENSLTNINHSPSTGH